MREIGYNRNLWILFIFSLVAGSILYSCTQQRGLAQMITYDTIVVPKQYRPSQVKPNQDKPTPPKTPEQIKRYNEAMRFIENGNKVLDSRSIEKLYDAVQTLANDRVNVANSYRAMMADRKQIQNRLDSVNTRLDTYQYTATKAEEAKRKAEIEKSKAEKIKQVSQDVNNKVVIYGLLFILFVNILHFSFTLWYNKIGRKGNNQVSHS